MTRYWLRFDDLCPTMDRSRWQRAEQIVERCDATPILAIVPDNRDPVLEVDAPDPRFWDRAREWQARGWVIGLHGYRHVYDSQAPSLLPFKSVSEFSGHDYDEQHRRIGCGLALLREQDLNPRVFVAPGHAFDDDTLKALADHELTTISDGFGFRASRDRNGLTWIPNQTRTPRTFPFGDVTIALHTNDMNDAAMDRLEAFVTTHRKRIGRDFEALVRGAGKRNGLDRTWESLLLAAFRWNARRREQAASNGTVT